MAKKNIPLLKRLRTRFLRMRHKKHFNMDDVVQKTECGAALCIAGHTLALAGYKYRFPDEYDPAQWFRPDGQEVEPLDEAQRLLGLTFNEAQLETDDYYENNNARKNGLFFRYDLKTPKQAAKVIEKLIGQASM